jgi:hypothetical protein
MSVALTLISWGESHAKTIYIGFSVIRDRYPSTFRKPHIAKKKLVSSPNNV